MNDLVDRDREMPANNAHTNCSVHFRYKKRQRPRPGTYNVQGSYQKQTNKQTESGDVLTHYHHMFNITDTTCLQIKMGMVAYLGGDHHMLNKPDTTCQQVNLGMVAYLGGVYDV